MRLSKTCSIRSLSTRTKGKGEASLGSEENGGILGMGSKSFPGIVHEYRGVNRLLIEGNPPLLDAGQVEKIVDHPQKPFGVLPGRQEQLYLLGGERTNNLLEKQMDHHLETGERSFQLVAHG